MFRKDGELILKKGAILIADAHYCAKHSAFFQFLKDLDSKKIDTPQLILMGDMFELLFGTISKTVQDNLEAIMLLNALSKKIEIIYFEGNHDFHLKKVFPDIAVYSLSKQPLRAVFHKQKILLSHGDTFTPLSYRIYTKLIRNRAVLSFIGTIDTVCFHCIIKWLKKRGENKNPCYKIDKFEQIIGQRMSRLQDKALNIVIEGHFHQDFSFKVYDFLYVNLASFACNHKYFIVQSKDEQLFLEEARYKESM